MAERRIYFPGNPWEQGHKITEFAWTAKVEDNNVWLLLDLKSDYYYAEDEKIEEDEESEDNDALSAWKAPIVWCNYHRCIISSTYWHYGGFKVCSVENYSLDYLKNREFRIDTNPKAIEDDEDFAF